MTYARINIKDGKGSKSTILLQITKETDVWLAGWKADKYGDRTEHFHLIDKSAITNRTPMKMNLHYGWLEEESK